MRTLPRLVILFLLGTAGQGAARAELRERVLEDAPGLLRVEIRVGGFRAEPVEAEGFRVVCGGCQRSEAGAPDLPFHRFEILAATAPTLALRILERETLIPDPALGAVAPVPFSPVPSRREYRRDPALAAAALRAEPRLLPPGVTRGLPLRGVSVPLAFLSGDGGDGRSVTVLKRVEVEIRWEAGDLAPSPRRLPGVVRTLVRNGSGGAWLKAAAPIPRPASLATPAASPTSAPKAGAGRSTAPGVSARITREAPDLGDAWLRFRIGDRTLDQNGEDMVYALSFAEAAKEAPELAGGIRIGSLRLYSGNPDTMPRSMGPLPVDRASHPGALREVPLLIRDDGDSTFDAGDNLLFFAQGTGIWKRVPGASGPVRHAFSADPWSFENGYYLSFAGGDQGGPALRLEAGPGDPLTREPAGVTRAYLRAERDLGTESCEFGHTDSSSGLAWYWHRGAVCNGRPDTVLMGGQLASPGAASLPDWVPGHPEGVHIGFHVFPAYPVGRFRPYIGGSRVPLPPAADSGLPGAWHAWTGPAAGGEAFRLDSLGWTGESRFLEGYSVSYPRRLVWRGKPLWIFPSRTSGTEAFRVEGGGGLACARIVDGAAGRILILDGEGRFQDSLPPGADGRWLVYAAPATLPEGALARQARPSASQVLRDLWSGDGARPEYLILAPGDLLPAAVALRDHRRKPARALPLRTSVVLLEDVYREFSSGRLSPTGIRDFLRWALHRWEPGGAAANPLRHVLLFGSGNYDYRGLAGGGREGRPMHVPPYQGYAGEEVVATDDFYSLLDSGETEFTGRGRDLSLGRLPARDLDQAWDFVRKTEAYDDPARAGEWRSRVVLAADDHLQRGKPQDLDDIRDGHTNDTEDLGKAMVERDAGLMVEKVYLLDYAINSSFRKPEAAQDLASQINRGALAVNYVGHGSPNQWADEVLLQSADVRGVLDNAGRAGMINAFSCAVGRHDGFVPGMSEILVMSSRGGAVAAVSATRESFPDPNVALADAFYRRAFPGNPAGDSAAAPLPVGDALREAKDFRLSGRDGVNDAKYNLLGEPVFLLRRPGLRLAFTARPDTLRALDCGTLRGTVAGGSGSGSVSLKMLAGPESKVYDLPYPMRTQYVEKRGPILFERTVPYRNGIFSADYLIPGRIPFGDTAARLLAFAWDASREMEGSLAVTELRVRDRVPGGPCSDRADGEGPRIRISGCESRESGGLDFPGRVTLALPSCLTVHVEDSVGGVLSAQGPDEGTTIEVPGVLDPFHPQPGLDELYRKSFRLPLDRKDFRPGPHVLKVTAEDGYGNRSLRLLRMDLTLDSSIQALAAWNVPNPVKRSGTAFHFSSLLPSPDVFVSEGEEPPDDRVEFTVRIHDQAGRVVKVLRKARSGQHWDGRDEWGNRLANGVYFYAVTARWRLPEGSPRPDFRTVATRRNTLVISR